MMKSMVNKKMICDMAAGGSGGGGPAPSGGGSAKPKGSYECSLINSSALGTLTATVTDDRCCKAWYAGLVASIANMGDQLPMPWDQVAAMMEIDSCTATDFGKCADEPKFAADKE